MSSLNNKNLDRIPQIEYSKFIQSKRSSRRRGIVAVYMAMALTAFLGAAALVIDVGNLYYRQTLAQRAADAAALAGAKEISVTSGTNSLSKAREFARRNGFDSNRAGYNVIGTAETTPGGSVQAYKVDILFPQPLMFATALGFRRTNVSVTATAELTTYADFNISAGGAYGVSDNIVTLSVFGPKGLYSYGDAISTERKNDGSDNPDYNANGYSFPINIPSNYRSTFGDVVHLEIFDPDGENPDGNANANAGVRIDELRTPSGSNGKNSSDATTTEYKLIWNPGSPGDSNYSLNNDQVVNNPASYQKATSSTDMKWVQDSNLQINLADSSRVNGSYRLQVRSTAGSSENGFLLRAGPPHSATMTDADWSTQYGQNAAISKITAAGFLPMNINANVNKSVVITLGTIPTVAAGGELTIRKFDTDVQNGGNLNTVIYRCSSLPGFSKVGVLSGNGEWAEDRIKLDINSLGTNYKEGVWTAEYAAGSQDTSVWSMSYANSGPGLPANLRLIR